MADREQRAELETLQAEQRALEAEQRQPHGPAFLARRAELETALEPLQAELAATEAKLREVSGQRARLEAEVAELRERLRRAAELRLSWVPLALLPAGLCLGVRVALDQALHGLAACVAGAGLAFLYGPRLLRTTPALKPASPEAPVVTFSWLRNAEGLGAALLLPVAALFALLPLRLRPEWSNEPADVQFGLFVGVVTVLLADRARVRAKQPGHTGTVLSWGVLLLATGVVVAASGWSTYVSMFRTWHDAARPWSLFAFSTVAWAVMAVGWPLLRRVPRASVLLALACALGCATALVFALRFSSEVWVARYGMTARDSAFVLAGAQLGGYGLFVGLRAARSLGTGRWRWSGAAACLVALLALAAPVLLRW